MSENEIGIYFVIYLFFLSVNSAGIAFLIPSFVVLPGYLCRNFIVLTSTWVCVLLVVNRGNASDSLWG